MVEAGVKFDHHQSDLWVPKNETTTNILLGKGFTNEEVRSLEFRCNITNSVWYDIPFAYDPFWD
jgi:hypothetical protein